MTLDLIEWLALTGLAQSVLILVHIAFRARAWRQAAPAAAYFCLLATAFSLQFALRLEDFAPAIRLALWFAWMSGPPLCYLFILQVADKAFLPGPRHFIPLSLVPLAALGALAAGNLFSVCEGRGLGALCPRLFDWLYWLGSMAGALSLLALWSRRDVFDSLRGAKGAKGQRRERYWLALTLVAVNALVVVTGLLRSSRGISDAETDAVLVTFGLAFLYLITTALFRIYPSPVQLDAAPRGALTPEEQALAAAVQKLMEVDKLYQEPAFSRADLARELKISESTLSRVINAAFGKSFPRLLNELRVGDAQAMLRNPGIPIQTVASEAGFNSLASFNRVFREITGETPSSFRRKNGEEAGN